MSIYKLSLKSISCTFYLNFQSSLFLRNAIIKFCAVAIMESMKCRNVAGGLLGP